MTVTVMTRVMRRMRQVGRICLTSFTPTPWSSTMSSPLKTLYLSGRLYRTLKPLCWVLRWCQDKRVTCTCSVWTSSSHWRTRTPWSQAPHWSGHRLQCIDDWYQIITKKGLDWHNVIMFRLHTAANVKSISLPVPESRPSLWKLNNVVSVMCKVSAICHCPVHSHTVTPPGHFYFKTNKTWLGQFWCRIFIKISAAVDLLCLIGPHNSQHHLLLPRLALTDSQEFTAQHYIQGSNWT